MSTEKDKILIHVNSLIRGMLVRGPILFRDLNDGRWGGGRPGECFDFEVGDVNNETGIDSWVHRMIFQVGSKSHSASGMIVRQTVWSNNGCDTSLSVDRSELLPFLFPWPRVIDEITFYEVLGGF